MEKLSPNRAQLLLRNKYTVFTMDGTVALRSLNKKISGELQFCSYFILVLKIPVHILDAGKSPSLIEQQNKIVKIVKTPPPVNKLHTKRPQSKELLQICSNKKSRSFQNEIHDLTEQQPLIIFLKQFVLIINVFNVSLLFETVVKEVDILS